MRYFILASILLLTACGETESKPQASVQPTLPRPTPSAFAQQKNCIACHNPTGNIVGPSWHAIADKYKGDTGAATKLTEKVLMGGSGSFGAVTMPPQAGKITADEARYMVDWVLNGAPIN